MSKIILKLVTLCFFLLFFSCNDEDLSESIDSEILVKKIIVKNLANNTILRTDEFEYSGRKIVKGTSSAGSMAVYSYIGDFISNIKIYDTNAILKLEYLYSYENNKLSQTIYKNYDTSTCEKRLYTYVSNTTLNFIYYTGDLVTQNTLYKSGTITLQDYEVIATTVQNHLNNFTSVSNFTYDNKNNAFKNVLGFNVLSVELDRVGGVNKNLTVRENNNGGVISFAYLNYTYNSNNYPTTLTIASSFDNNTSEYYY